MSAGSSSASVQFEALGCRVNQAERAGLEAAIAHRGHRTGGDESPDVIVVNTCAVTSNADVDGRKLVRQLHRRHPGAALVVTGCQAERDGDTLAALPGVRVLVANDSKHRIPELVDALASGDTVPSRIVALDGDRDERAFPEIDPGPTGGHGAGLPAHPARALVKIQDGCDRSCTFCVIPGTRGGSVSRDPEQVLQVLEQCAEQGSGEAVLTGIDLGSWGHDRTPRSSLSQLLDRIDRMGPGTRVRLSSLDPRDLDAELADRIASHRWICPHLHISLQSASHSVHRRMGRGAFPEQLRDRLDRIRRARPELALGLDLLSGFPGERDEDHAETLAWVREAPVSYLHVFPFSERADTAAQRLTAARVPDALRRARASELRALGERARMAFHQRHVGQRLEVVAERGDPGSMQGTSANFIRLSWPARPGAYRVGERVTVTLEEAGPRHCRGVPS